MRTASYSKRIIAFLLDWLVHFGGTFFGVLISLALVFADGVRFVGVITLILTFFWFIAFGLINNVVRQGRTGQTIGKRQQRIVLVSTQTKAAPGIGLAFLRWIVFTGFCLLTGGVYLVIDFLAPAFGTPGRRITDRLLSLEVIESDPERMKSTPISSGAFVDLEEPY